MKTTIALVAAAVACGAFAASAARAAPISPPTAIPPPGMTVQTVANGPGDQLDPHVSANLVSYTEFGGARPAIHYYDLASGTDSPISNGDGSFDVVSDVSSGTVVYTHILGGCQQIFSFDTVTAAPPSPLSGPCVQGTNSVEDNASIGAATIAWEDYDANPAGPEIIAYDRSTGTSTPISDAVVPNIHPAVSADGGTIAWERCDASGANCHIWDASRTAPGVWVSRQLTNDVGSDELPDTNGSVVVYSCTRGGVQDICWQPVAGGTETELGFTGRNPNISGQLITFEHYDTTAATPNWDVYAYDLSTGFLYRVTNTPTDEVLSDVWTDPSTGLAHVAWSVQEATNGYNVYAATFTPVQPDPPLTITRFAGVADRRGDAAVGLTFTDADPNSNLSQYSGTIDWGDGSESSLVFTRNPLGGFAAGGVHHYAHAGTYTATATVHDSGGASASRTTTIVVPSR